MSLTPRATRVRYAVLGVTFLAAFLLYLHRFCMSYAQRYIREDLGISNDDLSFCFSAFFLTYALAQVPSGWMSDRFGARRMLTIYILVWSFFTATMGLTVGFVSLLLVRLAAGIGQAGAYPTAASLIAKWIPQSSRGMASAFVAWGGRLGSGLAPILTSTLIVFFVPLNTPTELGVDGIIKLDEFADRLVAASYSSTERADLDSNEKSGEPQATIKDQIPKNVMEARTLFLSRLSPESQAAILDNAFQEKSKSRTGRSDDLVWKSSLRSASSEQRLELTKSIVASLNQWIQDDPIRWSKLSDLQFEREARALLEKTELTKAERQRCKRLMLEAVFPNSISKLYVVGWRQVMFTYGSLGLIVAASFWFVFRDRPSKHPKCNSAECLLILEGRPVKATEDQTQSDETRTLERPPMRAILHSRSLWLMCVTQWGANVGWVFLVTWLPRYLYEVHAVPLSDRGLMCSIPLWIGWVGMLSGGRLTDFVTRRFGLRRGRSLPIAAGRFMAMGAYLSCLLHPSPWLMVVAFGVVAFSTDLGSASIWAYKQDVGGNHVGSIHGWANMWGNLGATISPILLNFVVGEFNWDAAFITCAAAFGIAGVAALGVDATIPVERPPDVSAAQDKT
jgi:MFS transporter, ACS family, glucarate transporter